MLLLLLFVLLLLLLLLSLSGSARRAQNTWQHWAPTNRKRQKLLQQQQQRQQRQRQRKLCTQRKAVNRKRRRQRRQQQTDRTAAAATAVMSHVRASEQAIERICAATAQQIPMQRRRHNSCSFQFEFPCTNTLSLSLHARARQHEQRQLLLSRLSWRESVWRGLALSRSGERKQVHKFVILFLGCWQLVCLAVVVVCVRECMCVWECVPALGRGVFYTFRRLFTVFFSLLAMGMSEWVSDRVTEWLLCCVSFPLCCTVVSFSCRVSELNWVE